MGLMKHDLVNTFRFLIYLVTSGSGNRLFADGTIPATFKVTENIVTLNGVILVTYERAGEVNLREVEPIRT